MPYVANLMKVERKANRYLFNGKTTCVALVQQTAGAPSTLLWTAGLKVKDAKGGDILAGTAIATFNAAKDYPTGSPPGRHAALYISHTGAGIKVLDQWGKKPMPSERILQYMGEAPSGWQNNGDYFYVIEMKK